MKKFMMATAAIMLMAAVATTAGCNKDSINGGDSAGIVFNLRNDGGKMELLKWDSTFLTPNFYWYPEPDSIQLYLYTKLLLYLNQNNNFEFDEYYVYDDSYQNYDGYNSPVSPIACVGPVKGLNKITSIPQSGWVDEMAAQPGNGYVIRNQLRHGNHGFNEFIYARVYVEDWLVSTTGGIIGVTLRYEDNWKREPITK